MLASVLLQQSQGGGAYNLIMIGMIIVVFYFFMIRPQMKKAKDEKTFKESLNKGDKVVTISGIHGKIVDVSDRTFILEIDTNTKIKIEKTGISAEATKQYKTPEKK